jgi:hypothetical protein
MDLSSLKPELDEQNVNLAGVGLEWFGVDEFLALGPEQWEGDLLIDEEQKLYRHCGTGSGSVLSLLRPSVLSSIFTTRKYRSGRGVSGNLAGNGWCVRVQRRREDAAGQLPRLAASSPPVHSIARGITDLRQAPGWHVCA